MITITHQGPANLSIGIVYATGVDSACYPPGFDESLDQLLTARGEELTELEDRTRKDVRDVLRNGKYKPTGRGKPASEYLLSAARSGAFPRINAFVDICNFISLRFLLPVSIWDMERAGGTSIVVRKGMAGESYIFNQAGQCIDLEDLIVGCVIQDPGTSDPEGLPIVNPVKDSMLTKTTDASTTIAAIVYAPRDAVISRPPVPSRSATYSGILTEATETFRTLLSRCGTSALVVQGMLAQEATLEMQL